MNAPKDIKTIQKIAKELFEAVNQEIENLLLCPECYENAYKDPVGSFIVPCKKPHIVIWVNCNDYGFSPAKLMKQNEEGDVNVRFFGDYTNAAIPSSNCLMYSENMPENEHGAAHGETFELALQVSAFG